MRLLFVDPKSHAPYDGGIMEREGLGGTESTLIMIAEGLACHHEVVVEQLGRKEPFFPSSTLSYFPLYSPLVFNGDHPDVVVILRRIRLVSVYRRRFPNARLYVWLHNWQRPEVVFKRVLLAHNRCSLITVSDVLLRDTDRIVNGFAGRMLGMTVRAGGKIRIKRIYNPVDDNLQPETGQFDRNRMIFFSTANKGLRQVLSAFDMVRREIPGMVLDIAGSTKEQLETIAPGCTKSYGVNFFGRLPRGKLLEYVRRSLCVFYPQAEHPETFGLVFAESNAVGTPVLAHNFGAAAEVLGDSEQMIDAHDYAAILKRIVLWRESERPKVNCRPEFRLSVVLHNWLDFLNTE